MRPGLLPLRLLLLLPALLPGCAGTGASHRLIPAPASPPTPPAPGAPFLRGEFRGADGTPLPYRLLLPPDLRDGETYPLVLSFHGSGAIGTDNEAQLGAFVQTWAAPEIRRRFPAFVLAPQFPARSANYDPDPTDGLPASRSEPPLLAALALVDSLRALYPIDPRRIYVVGFSMGASTAWHALLLRPDLFAAAVPIAGVPPPRSTAPALRSVPVLLIHGNADPENPIDPDRAMYAALRQAGARHVRFWEYEGLDHAVPPDVAAGTAWRTWLFAQHR